MTGILSEKKQIIKVMSNILQAKMQARKKKRIQEMMAP